MMPTSGLTITTTTQYGKILQLVRSFGSETAKLDRVVLAWVATKGEKEVGITGVVPVSRTDWVVDPMALLVGFRNKGIGEKLVAKAIVNARQHKVGNLYTMTTYVKTFRRLGFSKIANSKIPQAVHTYIICFSCRKYRKSCFPQALRLKIS